MARLVRGSADYLKLGDWNAVCFVCGGKYKASELKKSWKGYWTCHQCWEPRHPQDFVRGIPDRQTVAWSQPVPAYSYVNVCTIQGVSAYIDLAIVDCCIVGNMNTNALPITP